MEPGSLVVVHCCGPREKFWGRLLGLTAAGVTLRGVPLDTFEDFLRQHGAHGPNLIGPITLFLPAHRVERVELDETSGSVEGLGARFQRVAGVAAGEALS